MKGDLQSLAKIVKQTITNFFFIFCDFQDFRLFNNSVIFRLTFTFWIACNSENSAPFQKTTGEWTFRPILDPTWICSRLQDFSLTFVKNPSTFLYPSTCPLTGSNSSNPRWFLFNLLLFLQLIFFCIFFRFCWFNCNYFCFVSFFVF